MLVHTGLDGSKDVCEVFAARCCGHEGMAGLISFVRSWRTVWGLGPAPHGRLRLPPTTLRTLLVLAFVSLASPFAYAQREAESKQLPTLRPPAVQISGELGDIWLVPDVGPPRELTLQGVQVGDRVSSAQVRRVMRELLDTGKYASVRGETHERPDGKVRLLIYVFERKVVARIDVNGGELATEQVLAALGLRVNQELTRAGLDEAAAQVRLLYVERGFPQVSVSGAFNDLPEPLRSVVTVTVAPGPPSLITSTSFDLPTPALPVADELVGSFGATVGQRLDHVELDAKKRTLVDRFHRASFPDAKIDYTVSASGGIRVSVRPGPQVTPRYEGLRAFDEPTLRAAVQIEDAELSLAALRARVLTFYEQRGYYDVRVKHTVVRSFDGLREDWVFTIQEGSQLRVSSRYFPCLDGPLSSGEVNDEIDGVLGEHLPGSEAVLGPLDPGLIDSTLEGSPHPSRVRVPRVEPWTVYSPAEYDRALTHLRDLYRAEGYLSATVGPATLLRRQCAVGTNGEHCRPLGLRIVPEARCPSSAQPMPVEELPVRGVTCQPDPGHGVFCEPVGALSVPIKLGPRTTLWDVEFLGNRLLVDSELFEAAELPLGKPVSQIELQRARRRVGDLYGDRGFAFAEVNVELELSADRTRGKARFVISEREPVTIRGFVVKGAQQTLESVVLGRLALRKGELYRRDLVRASEEQLGTLGVFSSVTVELEDPEVPAREKTVVVSVEERPSQYVDVKPGFSSGEGVRLVLEYGHRNVLGRALQLRFRFQLGYLPNQLILDGDVRRKYEALTFWQRLERSNSVTLEVPFATRFRLALEGVDVRDNTRDFGLTKRAAIISMSHRPGRGLSWVTGTSLEDNDVTFFNNNDSLKTYIENNPQYARLLNVPDGRSYAIALRLGGAWDRTDNPFGATRGTFVSIDSEPVVAFLDEGATVASDVACDGSSATADCDYVSRFVKLTGRVAGYIPFSDSGLSLALSLRLGANLQVVDRSVTYPDRLFFLGGSDSLRGHLQDSVVPQDVVGVPSSQLSTRGGDFLINPRAELRIPLTKVFQTALFLDTGNVWRDIRNANPWQLRYSAGTGLRVATPVGPLAFDYGFRLDRRSYESDMGAFHFSVGLF